MAADGSGLERLTHDDFFDHDPAWSPDGSSIAFAVNRAGLDHRIVVMGADGSNAATVFVCRGPCAAIDGGPAWSPDGTRMAFTVEMRDGTRAAKQRIEVMDVDGSNAALLSTGPLDVCCPAWGEAAASSGG
jgi:TolB protein